ncbi:hypothetical protein F4677DRAFT_415433 [Hypoxylon crocopeplum]|nr:hypothetical protein F4677DRAFT_415433 [Hypoxylon crocopeplum]
MSLYRWTLPSRAFTREKTKNNDPSPRGKFPTVHIGAPGTRRRANLSSTFASLFDRDENDLNATTIDDARPAPKELQTLSARAGNVSVPSKSDDMKCGVSFHRPGTPIHLTSRRRGTDSYCLKQVEAFKEPHIGSLLTEHNSYVQPPGGDASEGIRSPPSITRVRSASSSYPSEGIRSPPDHCRSPLMNTWSESLVSELSRFGTYPSHETTSESSISTNDVSILDHRVGQCLMAELAAAGGISDTDTRTTSEDYTAKPPLSDITSVDSLQGHRVKVLEACRGNDLATGIIQKDQNSPPRGNAIPTLDGQGSSTSAIRRSFPELRLSTCVSSFEDNIPFRLSNAGSTDRLRPSTESRATRSTKVHRQTKDNPYNTMPAHVSTRRIPRGPIAAITSGCHFDETQMPGLHFKHSNESSTTIVQRIQKFKFRKWIKKVCLRTKVRFDNVIKLEASPKALGKRKSKSQKSRRPKKHGKANRVRANSMMAYWPTPKPTEKTRRDDKEQERKAHWFIRSLRPKHSIQLPVQEKVTVSHRRVQSCPA